MNIYKEEIREREGGGGGDAIGTGRDLLREGIYIYDSL